MRRHRAHPHGATRANTAAYAQPRGHGSGAGSGGPAGANPNRCANCDANAGPDRAGPDAGKPIAA